jgi:protein-tyrosine phosphatase
MLGVINFRDFGGQRTLDGRCVRAGQLYRCGHLANLTDDDLERVLGLDFAVIADLRYAGERVSEPSPWPESYADRIVAHGGERKSKAPHLLLISTGMLSRDTVELFYESLYGELPFDSLYRPLFASTICRIASSDGRALIHCTAGKDRTGILVSLVLDCLGVPRDAIIAEYMRSSRAPGVLAMKPNIIARTKRRYGHELSEEAVDMLLDVQPAYLESAFAAMERDCGSVEQYLNGAGVDAEVRAKLRERLLEK